MKVSLISILPISRRIEIPTVHPAMFEVPACERGDIQIVHLTDAFCWVYLDGDRGHFKQTIPADQLAESIINDYRIASVGVTPEAYPGVMFVEGHLDEPEIRKKYAKELAALTRAQDAWLNLLVASADDEWQKYHQHRSVTGLARTAARYLGIERAWKIDVVTPSVPCPACSSSVYETAVICPHCNYVMDEARYKTMKFAGDERHITNAQPVGK